MSGEPESKEPTHSRWPSVDDAGAVKELRVALSFVTQRARLLRIPLRASDVLRYLNGEQMPGDERRLD